MKTYPQLAEDYILYDLPALQGHAYLAASFEMDGSLNIQRASPGYIAQKLDTK